MKNMNDRNSRNDKVMDIIFEAAADKYAQDIADETVECDMTADEEKFMLEHEDRIYQNVMKKIRKEEKTHRRLSLKKFIILAASLAVIISLAANASALRVFLFKTYTDMSDTFLNVRTGKVTDESYNSITKFEYKDDIIIPDWLPSGVELVQITDHDTEIDLEYKGEDIWFYIDEGKVSDGFSANFQTENNEFNVEEIQVMDMNGIIVDMCSEIGNRTFSVFWNSDNVSYEIYTNCSRIVLDTVLKNLKYLK